MGLGFALAEEKLHVGFILSQGLFINRRFNGW